MEKTQIQAKLQEIERTIKSLKLTQGNCPLPPPVFDNARICGTFGDKGETPIISQNVSIIEGKSLNSDSSNTEFDANDIRSNNSSGRDPSLTPYFPQQSSFQLQSDQREFYERHIAKLTDDLAKERERNKRLAGTVVSNNSDLDIQNKILKSEVRKCHQEIKKLKYANKALKATVFVHKKRGNEAEKLRTDLQNKQEEIDQLHKFVLKCQNVSQEVKDSFIEYSRQGNDSIAKDFADLRVRTQATRDVTWIDLSHELDLHSHQTTLTSPKVAHLGHKLEPEFSIDFPAAKAYNL